MTSIPKGSVRIKKPKKIETKNDCKEKVKTFLDRLEAFCIEVESAGEIHFYWVPWEIDAMKGVIDIIEEEAACKLLEEIRKPKVVKRFYHAEGNHVVLELGESSRVGSWRKNDRGPDFQMDFSMMVEHWDNGRPEQGNWTGTSLSMTFISETVEEMTEYQQKIMELMKSA